MKAAYLVKYGAAEKAFEIREVPVPAPKTGEVLIKVQGFGLNFADVMARLGLYKGAPPLPALLGYDVVGIVEKCGEGVQLVKEGDRVTALTLFGGYAEYAIAPAAVANVIPKDIPAGVAVALATQYSTAYFLSHDMAPLRADDTVLIHAAAGGVGTALVQMALDRKCKIFGTCSSPEKIEYLKQCGVHHPINYKEEDFEVHIQKILGTRGLDAVFDPVGGMSVKKGFRLLSAGGRVLTYGVSSMNNTRTVFGKIRVLAQFGLYHPLQFLSSSKGIIGVNMLAIAEKNPDKIAAVMKEVITLYKKQVLRPHVGGTFAIEQLAEAHQFLESRKSKGKLVVQWQ